MEGSSLSEGIAVGRFDSDDFGAEICEEFSGVDGSVVGEVDDSDIGERAWLWGVGHGCDCNGATAEPLRPSGEPLNG